GGAGRGAVVVGFVDERDITALAQGQQRFGKTVRPYAVTGMGTHSRVRIGGWRQTAAMRPSPADAAAVGNRCDVANLVLGPGPERQLVVPQHLHSVLRRS